MKRETIERLAIDSAAGELNEDAEVLFQTYLASNPQARQWADNIRQIFDETQAAIRTKMALTKNHKVAPKITPAFRIRWVPAARWAAVIFLGTVIGFSAGRWETTGQTQRVAIQKPSPEPKPVENVADLQKKYVGTFWGDKMLALVDNTSRCQHKVNLHDIRSWDSYKQFTKENKDE
jgi:hypothetical protein